MAFKQNVGNLERAASVIIGGIALSQVFNSERSPAARSAAASAAAGLLFRGVSGHCPLYSAIKVDHAPAKKIKAQSTIERSAAINKTLAEVKSFLEGKTPFGKFVASGADNYEIALGGKLWMLNVSQHVDGKRTLIKMTWDDHYSEAQGEGTDSKMSSGYKILELRKLKALLETGEIPTIEGQTHGERSKFGAMVENFGNAVIEKIQSRTPLNEEPLLNQENVSPERKSHLKEALA